MKRIEWRERRIGIERRIKRIRRRRRRIRKGIWIEGRKRKRK